MDQNKVIKCPGGCKSDHFIVISEGKGPYTVDKYGNVVSKRSFTYKCSECLVIFQSEIGPNTSRLLNG